MKIYLNNANFLEKKEREKILRTVEKILKDKKRDGEISITFVSDKYIKGLNKKYRGIDLPTDVLSFRLGDGNYIIGDIYIGKGIAKKQAKKFRHSLWDEIFLLIIHGVLHILGYTHNTPEASKEMREEEKFYINGVD